MFMNKKEETKGNNNLLIGVIVALSLVVAIMWFFLWKMSWWEKDSKSYDKLTLQIITDSRDIVTPVEDIVNELKSLPSIKDAKVKEMDFNDKWVKELLEEAKISALPAFIFSTNNFDVSNDPQQFTQDWQIAPKINAYLQPLSNEKYYLNVWATYNPFVERSDRGFRTITKEQYDSIVNNSYIEWEEDSKFVWIEYSDLECPFCAKFHKEGTTDSVMWEFEWEISLAFNHFPLSFHNNAQKAAEILECLWEQKGSDAFYKLMNKSFAEAKQLANWNIDASESSSEAFLVKEAVNLWANEDELKKCVLDWKYTDKVSAQMDQWTKIFGVTWTPWNVLINKETLEYDVISWAYPASSFNELIEKLK